MTDEERKYRRHRVLVVLLAVLVLSPLLYSWRHPVPHGPQPTTCEQRWEGRRAAELAYWAGEPETSVHDRYVADCKEATHLDR